jgi:hypothetical protein
VTTITIIVFAFRINVAMGRRARLVEAINEISCGTFEVTLIVPIELKLISIQLGIPVVHEIDIRNVFAFCDEVASGNKHFRIIVGGVHSGYKVRDTKSKVSSTSCCGCLIVNSALNIKYWCVNGYCIFDDTTVINLLHNRLVRGI